MCIKVRYSALGMIWYTSHVLWIVHCMDYTTSMGGSKENDLSEIMQVRKDVSASRLLGANVVDDR